ncbi:MAG: type I glyceraldehyde-3-phosphate dehydrogenase [Parcubacteria group bacterium RIFCSPHIGHO2_01_FULL_47_10b]|nr:MAG: type I glyceraldehyde-3-phosphate dehydrogenase [Parcubacteria group bacterium RIFCSPHIGHO2_01_FULL_47_10b]
MPTTLAINGFGRIGRTFFKQALEHPGMKIAAVNDLGDLPTLAYLLKYDSTYHRYNKRVEVKGNSLVVDGKEVRFTQEKDPSKLPWKDLGVDIVIESTGFFTAYDEAKAHLDAGAKRVVISAPAKDENQTIYATPNVNIEALKNGPISCNASCTTNATTPIAAVLSENPGIAKALLNTVHAYTATQSLVDGPIAKDPRRGRAAAQNIIPSTTGAAKATGKVVKAINGLFDGIAIRVPVISGSISDFTFLAKRKTSVEEINQILSDAAKKPEWQGILTVSEEPLVSSDILGQPFGAIVDLEMTQVVDGDLVKVLSWYDNEWGYCAMLLKHVEAVAALL